jgi:aminobenzoyl-glutamate utilization protein A
MAEEHRMSVPDDDELARWFEQARDAGANEEVLQQLEGGFTGAVAVLNQGDGPTVALRVDIDALPITESTDGDHEPAAEGFRSENEGFMHACGHDSHATIGLGVLEAIKESDFSGTLKVFFQPGEEMIAGGKAMAKSGHLDDVDYLLAVHIGLDHPTGEVVAGVDGFLAVNQFEATFSGAPAHAGGKPNEGRNAMQAMAAAVGNLYAIPRHDDGPTRVNVGVVEGGTATNIIPESVTIEGEVRGVTTELKEYMWENAQRIMESAAQMHDCSVEIESNGEAPSATSDQAVVDVVHAIASSTPGVDSPMERDTLGGSEDATYLMQEVQDNGGLASYVGVGTDHPGGHHTSTFDVDESSLSIGIDVLADSIVELAARRP